MSWKAAPTLLNQGGVNPTHMWFHFPLPRVSCIIRLHQFKNTNWRQCPFSHKIFLGMPGICLQICVSAWQVTKKIGERNAGLPGLQAISSLSLFPPIANKWGPITRRLQNIELDSWCILGEDLVLCQHLPHTRIPTSFYFIFFLTEKSIDKWCLSSCGGFLHP